MSAIPNLKQEAPLLRKHVTQWGDPDLSQAAYCREHALCPHNFKYYKTNIRLD